MSGDKFPHSNSQVRLGGDGTSALMVILIIFQGIVGIFLLLLLIYAILLWQKSDLPLDSELKIDMEEMLKFNSLSISSEKSRTSL